MDPVLLSSKKMDWGTPKGVYAALNDEFDFVLDAAASDKNAKCSEYYTEKDDALIQSWNKGGAVFCNPPYGRHLGKWVKKACEEYYGIRILHQKPWEALCSFIISQNNNIPRIKGIIKKFFGKK